MANIIKKIITGQTQQVVSAVQFNTFDIESATQLLEFNVFADNNHLYSSYNIDDWSLFNQNGTHLKTNTLLHCNYAGLYQGNYNAVYRLYKKILGEFDSDVLYIDEISQTRNEVRLKLFDDSFANVKSLDTAAKLPIQDNNGNSLGLYLNFGNNNIYPVINWVIDIAHENSIIYKLLDPLPDTIEEKETVVVCLRNANDIEFTVNLYSADSPQDVTILKNPNWAAKINNKSKKETDFYNWDQLLATNPTSSYQLINQYFSGSLTGIDLNVDFTNYDNFVFYSSAQSRLENFKYKLELIENYTTVIDELQLQVSSSFITDTLTINNNIAKYDTKLKAVFSTFDDYDKYMYYDSGSSDIQSKTWPKVNTTNPYTLYSTTSETATNFYESQISTASIFDRQNVNALINTVPEHIQSDDNNIGYVTFIEMIAQHFDILWLYVSHLNSIYDRQESLYTGLSKDLVYNMLKSLGWDVEFGQQFENLWYSTFGGNNDTSVEYIQVDSEINNPTPKADISKQIWKRILNNLPFLLKNKGTSVGIRALINCYGIPDTILRIREYGGPDLESHISKYTFDKFTYAWQPTGSNYNFTITGSVYPETIEFRFKTINADNNLYLTPDQKTQVLYTATNGTNAITSLRLNHQVNTIANLEFIVKDIVNPVYTVFDIKSIPIYDGNWWSVMLQQSGSVVDLYAKQSDGVDIVQQYSSSFNLSPADSYGFNYCTFNFPGDNSSSINQVLYPFGKFEGQIQEIRFWNNQLSETAFNNHVNSVIAYNGNNLTASYYDLAFRLPLGTEAYLSSSMQMLYTSSSDINYYTSSKHPNDLTNKYYVVNQPSTMSFVEVVEIQSLDWPDVSANRMISNKIRIEDNSAFLGNELDLQHRTERSAYDNYPTDSPKIGVYLSPTNEINEDIAQQMGGFRIDNYIGDEEDYYTDEYADLLTLRNEYFKKYKSRSKFEQYIRLLRFYDHSLFNQIKTMLPARSKGLVGLVIEPHMLERPKFKTINKPILENLDIYSTLPMQPHTVVFGDVQTITASIDSKIVKINSVNYPQYNASYNVYDLINMYGNMQTMITSSIQSSTRQMSTFYIDTTPWISGSDTLVTEMSLINPPALTNSIAWTDVANVVYNDTTIAYTPLIVSILQYNEISKIIDVGGYGANYNWNFANVNSIRGVELKLIKETSDDNIKYATDYLIKLNDNVITDITAGDNKADLSTHYATDGMVTSYYGSISDKWGLTWNKFNIKNIHTGVAIINNYNGSPTRLLTAIQHIAIRVNFNMESLIAAEVQDFEPTDWSNLKYNGCKISSSDFNQPSLDTPDGGAVVEFHIVNDTPIIIQPDVNPIFHNINNSNL